MPVDHAGRPVVPDIVRGSHHKTAVPYQVGQSCGAGTDIQDRFRAYAGQLAETNAEFNRPLINAPAEFLGGVSLLQSICT